MKALFFMLLLCALPKLQLEDKPKYVISAPKKSRSIEKRFVKKCLCQNNIEELFPRASKFRRNVLREMMDTMKIVKAEISIRYEIKSSKSCDGIYFYKLYSFWPNPKMRGAEFFQCFCILDKKLITFSHDTASNRRLYMEIEPGLIKALGREKTQNEREYLIKGGANFD